MDNEYDVVVCAMAVRKGTGEYFVNILHQSCNDGEAITSLEIEIRPATPDEITTIREMDRDDAEHEDGEDITA